MSFLKRIKLAGSIKKYIFCLCFLVGSKGNYAQNVFKYSKLICTKNNTFKVSAKGFAFFSLSDGICCFVFSNSNSLEEEINKSKSLKYILFDGNKFLDYFNVIEYVDTAKLHISNIKLSSNKKCEEGDKISYYKCRIEFLFSKKDLLSKDSNYLNFCLNSLNKNLKLYSIFKVKDPTMIVTKFFPL